MRIPISTKLIFLTVSFLIATTAFFAKQSSDLLAKEMTQREEYSNLALAQNRASEVESILVSAKERAEVIGTLLLKQQRDKSLTLATDEGQKLEDKKQDAKVGGLNELDYNFLKDKNLIALEIYKTDSAPTPFTLKVRDDFFADEEKRKEFKLTGTGEDYFKKLRGIANFNVRNVKNKNIEIQNATFQIQGQRGLPLFSIGVPLVKDTNDQVTYVAVAHFLLSVIQKPFSQLSEREFYLVGRDGVLLAHQNEDKALARHNFNADEFYGRAYYDQNAQRQVRSADGQHIGGYVKKPFFGVTIVSQIPMAVILEPAKKVQREAVRIAGIVVAIAVFFIFLFSMTLTNPIERLADMIALVSKGNFDVKARTHVRSNDEVGDLAQAFDHMTEGLKERDKVKNLFNKFHGSSITEDLLKKDIGVGGTNKDVTIFFSDVRGFTAFSEKRTPEEVVEMLNEYFEVMVSIINRNGGVVDKFIGDAIMAVWGAPTPTPEDTSKALKACLEMRQGLWELNKKREARGHEPLIIGMGLHAGKAISGTIGSAERMEYTVIGDTVNMTSRIESSTKAFGADLLVSEVVAEKVGNSFKMEYAGSAEVKGKTEPLKLYKVRALKDSNGDWLDITTPYSDYKKGDADKVKVAS